MSGKIALLCPGLGRSFRGYERFASELFEAINGSADVTLFPGAGRRSDRVRPVGGAGRDSLLARGFSAISRDVYYWESLSFALAGMAEFRKFDLLHYSEPVLNLAFTRFGPRAPRRLFSHALNMGAEHTLRCHHIHQASPEAYDAALAIGVPVERMTLLPYGIRTGSFNPDRSEGKRRQTKASYGLPLDRVIVLCVAAVNRTHKRVDYLISEMAALSDRPHVVLCGALDEPELLNEARNLLGTENVTHLYVPNDKIVDLYGACDLFVLPSIVEGFGLGALEAQLSGLPTVVNDSKHFRWLLGDDAGVFADMSQQGALASAISDTVASIDVRASQARQHRPRQVERFDWQHVLPDYLAMYAAAQLHSQQLIEEILVH